VPSGDDAQLTSSDGVSVAASSSPAAAQSTWLCAALQVGGMREEGGEQDERDDGTGRDDVTSAYCGHGAMSAMGKGAAQLLVLLPSVAPPGPAAAQYRALLERHVETTRNTPDSQQRCRQGRGRGCVKMSYVPRCPLDQVVQEVMLRCVKAVFRQR
jgi:hypothetical protein